MSSRRGWCTLDNSSFPIWTSMMIVATPKTPLPSVALTVQLDRLQIWNLLLPFNYHFTRDILRSCLELTVHARCITQLPCVNCSLVQQTFSLPLFQDLPYPLFPTHQFFSLSLFFILPSQPSSLLPPLHLYFFHLNYQTVPGYHSCRGILADT